MKNIMALCLTVSLVLTTMFFHMAEMKETKKDKKSCFECGFENLSEKKTSFSTNFIMLMMMFLIFDIEISILIPFMMTNKNNQTTMMLMSNLFIVMLVAMTLKEWSQGSLEWTK